MVQADPWHPDGSPKPEDILPLGILFLNDPKDVKLDFKRGYHEIL